MRPKTSLLVQDKNTLLNRLRTYVIWDCWSTIIIYTNLQIKISLNYFTELKILMLSIPRQIAYKHSTYSLLINIIKVNNVECITHE